MSEGLAQGPCVAAGVGFNPAILRTQGTELTTEPPCPPIQYVLSIIRKFIMVVGEAKSQKRSENRGKLQLLAEIGGEYATYIIGSVDGCLWLRPY